MTSIQTKRVRLGLALLASTFIAVGAPAHGQANGSAFGAYQEDPGAKLARYVRDLASQPRSLSALLGAGNAALEMNDPQTALTFFARAEEVAPRDGRVKAGMASAFVQSEQAQAALRFFGEAVSLGIPLSMIAKDRGLAYDMSGDTARAQADYAIAMQRSDPEVERRMALSKAISGDAAGALAMIEPQVRRGDRAGYRAKAFILALGGDTAGAIKAVEAVMPAKGSAMAPFLARLPHLAAADRAMAVHFGRFPNDGQTASFANRPYQSAEVNYPSVKSGTSADASASPYPYSRTSTAGSARKETQRSAPPQSAAVPAATGKTAAAADQAPKRRTETRMVERIGSRFPVRETVVVEEKPKPSQTKAAAAPVPMRSAPQQAQPQQTVSAPPVQQQAAATVVAPPAYSIAAPVQTGPIATADLAPSTLATDAAVLASQPVAGPAPVAAQPAQTAPAATRLDFSDVVAAVQSLPAATIQPAPQPKPAAKAVAAAAKPEPKPAAVKTEAKIEAKAKAAPPEPSRIWVQLAVGQDKSVFASEFKRLKGKAPELLSGKSAWTTPLRATNRLLVGPFKTEQEARLLVNQLSKAQIPSYSWVSEAGQKIDKLPTK